MGAQEYSASKDKAELLKTVLKDSIARTASYNYKLEFTGSFVEPVIEKVARGCTSEAMFRCILSGKDANQRKERFKKIQEDMELKQKS